MGFAFCWEDRDCRQDCSVREVGNLFCWRARFPDALQTPRACSNCAYRRQWVRGEFRVQDFVREHDRRVRPRRAKKVLVIDSDPHIRFALEDMVSFLGYDCLSAGDGEEGLILAEGTDPDLIITDLILPRLDGYQLCRRLRAGGSTREIPIIIVTTRDRKKDAEAVRDLGAEGLLIKPFRSRDLSENIERSLTAAHSALSR